MDQEIRIIDQFVDKTTGKPITGTQYWAKVMDKDVFADDFIDAPSLDEEGRIDILSNLIVTGETTPDIYFVLLKDKKEIFRSDVFKNTVFMKPERPGEISTVDFGVFKV
ncbi:MAG: hypothetical protein K8S56_04100 [Candidatus Cloacimonetes bacterium]|nr:hypothetical protein [Candidatus Cloacimonadota bacterium]